MEEIDEKVTDTQVKQIDDESAIEMKIIPHDKLVELQGQDEQCTKLIRLPRRCHLRDILYSIVKEDTFDYKVVVLPKALIGHVLMEGHNNLGHNGIQ